MTILVEGYLGTNIKIDLGRLLLRMPFIKQIFPRKQNKDKVTRSFLLNVFFSCQFFSPDGFVHLSSCEKGSALTDVMAYAQCLCY